MADNQALRAALVGCGSVSQRGILPHLAMADARAVVDLVSVCDLDADRARQAAERFDLPAWRTDLTQVLEKDDPDMVLIATPVGSHYNLGRQAVEAGKHVYMQKTITSTVEEADQLIRAADRQGVKIVAAPGQMLSPGLRRLREMIGAGTFGTVYWAFAATSFIGHEYESFREDNPIDPTWYYTSPGGGPIRDMAVYTLHTLTGLLGPARRVSAMSGIGLPTRQWAGREYEVSMDDNTVLLLDFGEARFGVVAGQFCYGGPTMDWGFTGVYGSGGSFEITGRHFDTAFPAEVAVAPHDLAAELDLGKDPVFGTAALPYLSNGHLEMPEAHVWADIHHLADVIRSDRPALPSAEQARHVLEIIEQGYRAAQTGRAQPVLSTFVIPEL